LGGAFYKITDLNSSEVTMYKKQRKKKELFQMKRRLKEKCVILNWEAGQLAKF
jgi:hypothetical protein